jgi:hypothetical protein
VDWEPPAQRPTLAQERRAWRTNRHKSQQTWSQHSAVSMSALGMQDLMQCAHMISRTLSVSLSLSLSPSLTRSHLYERMRS